MPIFVKGSCDVGFKNNILREQGNNPDTAVVAELEQLLCNLQRQQSCSDPGWNPTQDERLFWDF